ncbi:hypothetical protein HMI54_013035 [Coelomomyces lativittatus]|nr:hypothetical protein HMI54_013035 [Coelomomyces lativittatus]
MGQVLCSCRCCPKQRIKPAPYQPLSPDTEPSAIHDMAPLIESILTLLSKRPRFQDRTTDYLSYNFNTDT